MEKIRISVLGVGHLGKIHAKLLSQNKNFELVGVFDTHLENATNFSQEFGFNVFTTIDDAIDASDAAIIAAPTIYHKDIAVKLISKNKHCFIEKPITASYDEACDLIRIAKENNVLIQVGHVERFNPAMSYLTNEKISPLFIESHRLSPFRPRAIDVSVIHDLMIHDIDLLLWLTNSKVTTIDSTGVSVLTDTVDIANVRLTFESGCVANVTASRISAKPMRKMRIFQKNAYFSLDFGKPEIEIFKIDDNNSGGAIPADMLGNLDTGIKNNNIVYFKPDIPQSNAIVAEHDSFCQAIKGKGKIAVDAIQAADALRIADIIDNQIKNNKPIN